MDERRPVQGGLAIAGVAMAAFLAVYLHLRLGAVVSPVRQTVSDYVLVPAGKGAFAAMCLALAVGSLGLVSAVLTLRPYGGARGNVVVLLLTAWSLGLTVAALFPTDPMGGPMSFAGETHRWAIVLAFVSLPAAARMLARPGAHAWAPYGGTLRFWSLAGFAALGVLMISYVPVVFPGVAHGPVLIGLSERVVLFVHLTLVVTLARPLLGAAAATIRSGRNATGAESPSDFVVPDAYGRNTAGT